MIISSRYDPYIILSFLGLSGLSIFIIASSAPSLFLNQSLFFLIGIVFFIFFSFLDATVIARFSGIIYLGSLLLLILVFFVSPIRGSHRWFDFGNFILQPSEIIKPFIILFFARLSDVKYANRYIGFFYRSSLFIPLLFLIFRQPDLGNVIIFILFFICLEIAGGISKIILIVAIFLSTVLLPFLFNFLRDYQKLRIVTFLNPQMDPKGAGYNAIQAMIAVGSGGIFGAGLGKGTQSKLLFLPEFQTDFIFSSIVESIGLFGGMALLIFYGLLLGRLLFLAIKTSNNFSRFFILGLFSQLFFQVFINIGMNLGLLPITGITLPLVSYGGSSILSTFIGLGIAVSLGREKGKQALVIGQTI